MRSILLTYPGFGQLPAGIKRLLLESENFFFTHATFPAARAHALDGERDMTGTAWHKYQGDRKPHRVNFGLN